MPCTRTDPGHATTLTTVRYALALALDRRRAPVPATVLAVDGERIVLALPAGTLEARSHDAGRLDALLDAARSDGRDAPTVLFTAAEHQLFVAVDPGRDEQGPDAEREGLHAAGIELHPSPCSPTGTFAAFNLALPWHAPVACGSGAPRLAPLAAVGLRG